MGLYFHNNYSKATVLLAVGLPDNSCFSSGAAFNKRGWWSIKYGDTVEVFSGDLSKIIPFICYFYAIASDGTFWAGPYDNLVSHSKFDQCWYDDTGMDWNRGFRYFTMGTSSKSSHTINLHA